MNIRGLGYRQRAILAIFDDHETVPVGFLCRQLATDNKTVNVALRGLAGRGLVERVRFGVWARTVV